MNNPNKKRLDVYNMFPPAARYHVLNGTNHMHESSKFNERAYRAIDAIGQVRGSRPIN